MDERIGHYRVVSELGRGGMGVVYKAHEESLNRFVAIKMLGDHLATDPNYVQRFLREAQSAASLNHPNIVHIHMVGEHEGRHYFAMEYVTGTNLQQLLQERGRLPIEDAARLVIQAAAGLAAAHDQGVIHRDIKPANLLIDDRGLVKIADFGLAFLRTSVNRLTATGVFMGTPGYLAPEQCREEEVDQRTDIYALGVTFYEALAGRMPFDTTNPLALLRQIMEVEPPDVCELNPEVDETIRGILQRMMAKDRALRPASCHELITELQAHLDRLTAAGVGASAAAPMVGKPVASAALTPAANASEQVMGGAPTMVVGSGVTPPLKDPPTEVSASQSPDPAGQATMVSQTEPVSPPAPATAPPVAATQAAVVVQPRSGGLSLKMLLATVLVVVGGIIGGFVAVRMFGGGAEAPATLVVVQPTATEVPMDLEPDEAKSVTALIEPTHAPATAIAKPQNRPAAAKPTATAVPVVAAAVPVATQVVAPPKSVPVLATPTASVIDGLIVDLSSDNSSTLQRAAKILYRRHRNEPQVQIAAGKALLAGFAEKTDDGHHVDAMAWLCNILGVSGNKDHAATLEQVVEQSRHRKIKGYAQKNLKLLK